MLLGEITLGAGRQVQWRRMNPVAGGGRSSDPIRLQAGVSFHSLVTVTSQFEAETLRTSFGGASDAAMTERELGAGPATQRRARGR
jgi:hypothetical protein